MEEVSRQEIREVLESALKRASIPFTNEQLEAMVEGYFPPPMGKNGLLPCPFCGGEMGIAEVGFGKSRYFYPTCFNHAVDCPARNMMHDYDMGGATIEYPSKEDAIKAANTRKNPPIAGN